MANSIRNQEGRQLLATLTNEPFQPVRLYYTIPSKLFVLKKLKRLRCVVEAPEEKCLQWLFEAEAKSLQFFGGYDDVPPARRPIVIGRIRFPDRASMTIETTSIPRAIECARFFGPRLGPKVLALRVRLVNRCFAGDEGSGSELCATLDRDVTVVDPRAAEEELRRDLAAVKSMDDHDGASPEDRARRFMERRKKDDVPPVEDFPLAPEEETPDFLHLATTLQFRLVRAVEHWKGNTHLTLPAIIMRTVEQGMQARGS